MDTLHLSLAKSSRAAPVNVHLCLHLFSLDLNRSDRNPMSN